MSRFRDRLLNYMLQLNKIQTCGGGGGGRGPRSSIGHPAHSQSALFHQKGEQNENKENGKLFLDFSQALYLDYTTTSNIVLVFGIPVFGSKT
jgi:hypothetical protein